MNKELKSIKSILGLTIKSLFKLIATIITNLTKIVYIIIYNINNLFAKLFMKAPRVARVITIYVMIALIVYGMMKQPKVIIKEETKTEVSYVEIEKDIELEELETIEAYECELSEIECKIYNSGISKGMTREQALIVVAISKHETGSWTSAVYKNKHNFGGIMRNGKLASYNNDEEGIDNMTTILKTNYFDKGLNTIEQIGKRYCPVGAKNDPNGLNKNWIPNVTKIFNSYLSK